MLVKLVTVLIPELSYRIKLFSFSYFKILLMNIGVMHFSVYVLFICVKYNSCRNVCCTQSTCLGYELGFFFTV